MTRATERLRDAFNNLEARPREILEATLFAGQSSRQIAEALGMTKWDVQAVAISTMRTLRWVSLRPPEPEGNDGLLALHALHLLEPDEAEAVERAVRANPSLERRYLADCDLVAAVCSMWPIDPPDELYRRLLRNIRTVQSARRGGVR